MSNFTFFLFFVWDDEIGYQGNIKDDKEMFALNM